MTWSTRLLLAAVCGVAVASVYAGQPVLGQLGHDLGVPPGAVGWFIAVGQLGYLAGLVLLVPWGDRWDRRPLIVGHLFLVAVGLIVTVLSPTTGGVLAGLAIAGFFAVVVQTTVAYTSALSTPSERGYNLGIVTSGVVIGILGSRILAGLLADVWGWRSIFAVLAVLTVLLGGLSWWRLPADRRSTDAARPEVVRSFVRLFTDPMFVSRGAIAFFGFASFGTLWSGVALPLAQAPWHLSPSQIGLFGIAGLTGAVGAVRSGRWADAGRAQQVTGLALVLLIMSWVAIGQLPGSLILLVVGVILLDFAIQAVHVSNQHLLTADDPTHASTTIGAYMIFYSLGSAVGAATTTAVYDAAGWTGSTILGAGFAGAGLVAWVLGTRAVRS